MCEFSARFSPIQSTKSRSSSRITKETHQVVVVGVEPLAQFQPPLLRRVRPAAREGKVAGEGAAGEVVEAVVFLCVLMLVV